MVVGYRRDAGFRDVFGDRESEGDVHGDRDRVFHDEQLDPEIGHEPAQAVLEHESEVVDRPGHRFVPGGGAEACVLDREDFRVVEVGFRYDAGMLGIPVRFAREEETLAAHPAEYGRPFLRLQGYSVGSVETGGDEADPAQVDDGVHVHAVSPRIVPSMMTTP